METARAAINLQAAAEGRVFFGQLSSAGPARPSGDARRGAREELDSSTVIIIIIRRLKLLLAAISRLMVQPATLCGCGQTLGWCKTSGQFGASYVTCD